ncbi:MAG: hypothetical protein ACTSYD_01780 [Candidatus Heimdallarchaeaceae archaeon]
MLKCVFVQKTSGSSLYFNCFYTPWSKNSSISGLEGFFTAVTSIISEFNEVAPVKVEFGENDQVVYCHADDYILGIVCSIDHELSQLKRIQNAFKRRFKSICKKDMLDPAPITELLTEKRDQEEKRAIISFAKYLKRVTSKQNIQKTESISTKIFSVAPFPLVIRDVDLLIASNTGQPIYFMQTLSLLYEPTILASFIAAIQDLGDALGVGTIKRIVGKNIDIFIVQLKKAFAFVLTLKSSSSESYRRFATFISHFCNSWLDERGIEIDEALSIYEHRYEFESFLQLIVESDAWETHKIKEREREIVERAAFNSLADQTLSV